MLYRFMVLNILLTYIWERKFSSGFEVHYIITSPNCELQRHCPEGQQSQISCESCVPVAMLRDSISLRLYGCKAENENSLKYEVKTSHGVALFATDIPNSKIAIKSYMFYIASNLTSSIELSDIRRGQLTPRVSVQDTYINSSDYTSLWFGWSRGVIQAGRGGIVGEQTLISWTDGNPIIVLGVGIGTSYGGTGTFKIKNDVKTADFSGYFNRCNKTETRSDLPNIGTFIISDVLCAGKCAVMEMCFGFNYHSLTSGCELLSYGSEPVTTIMRSIKTGWNFYAKCYDTREVCVGCLL